MSPTTGDTAVSPMRLSMSLDVSTAMGIAPAVLSARDNAPVPAPTSTTQVPRREPATLAIAIDASRSYITAGPRAHATAAP